MGILTLGRFYIYMIINLLRTRAYVRFAEIGAKSGCLAKPNVWSFFNMLDNQRFSQMRKC